MSTYTPNLKRYRARASSGVGYAFWRGFFDGEIFTDAAYVKSSNQRTDLMSCLGNITFISFSVASN